MKNIIPFETEIPRKLGSAFSSRAFMGVLITLGILLRLKHYLENRSLWLDEAWLSLGISAHSFSDILTFVPFSNDLALPPIVSLL